VTLVATDKSRVTREGEITVSVGGVFVNGMQVRQRPLGRGLVFLLAFWFLISPAAWAQDAPKDKEPIKEMPKPVFAAGLASGDVRQSGFGTDVEGRILGAFSQFPLAFGATFTEGTHIRRASGGISFSPFLGTWVTVVGQYADQSAKAALGINSNTWLNTNAISTVAGSRLIGLADRFSVFAMFDAWYSPGGKTLIDNNDLTATFTGARGYRLAPGIRWDITDNLSFSFAGGIEKALLNGDDGEFFKADVRSVLGQYFFELNAWKSANFGNGTQATIGYQLSNAMTAAVYGGYKSKDSGGAFAGVRLTMPLGGPLGYEGPTNMIGELNSQFASMQQVLAGMPTSARNHAVQVTVKPKPLFFIFETFDGQVCTSAEATPACTFDHNTGLRITVTRDPDYNKTGHGADDLWYAQFDSSGHAAVYNQLGNFQYFADVTAFAGYISGTTIGVGTSGLYWENTANGTYWVGKNGVLYSANVGEARYGQAVN
jgi:hypothetical protein